MRNTGLRFTLLVLLAGVVCLWPATGDAAGTITNGGNQVAGTAPIQGGITLDENAGGENKPTIPALGTLSPLGPMTGSLPALPDFGDGSDGDFTQSTTTTLSGGTFQYESYTIDNAAVVTYDGEVTLMVKGDVLIRGELKTEGSGRSITILCGGDLALVGKTSAPASQGMIEVEGDSSVRLEAAGDVRIGELSATTNARINTETGRLTVRAHGVATGTGNVFLSNASLNALSDSLTVQASSALTLDDTGLTSMASILLQAFGGDIRIVNGSNLTTANAASHVVEAMGGIDFTDSTLGSTGTPVSLTARAHGGSIEADNGGELHSTGGSLDLRARDALTFSDTISLDGESVLLGAGSDGILGNFDEVQAGGGDFTAIAGGPIVFERARFGVNIRGDIHIASTNGGVDVSATAIRTLQMVFSPKEPSGSILIETWAPNDIAVGDLTTADSDVRSGSIEVFVHQGDAGPPPVQSFFLPKAVNVKLNAANPEKSSLSAGGFFDVGPGNPDLSGEATVNVGGLEVTADLEVQANGRVFRLRGSGLDLKITRALAGSSRTKFKMKVKTDLTGLIDINADLVLRFRTGNIDGFGTVLLTNGRYKLGAKRGDLKDPVIFPFRVKAKAKGPGKDSLTLLAGIATEGGPPANAPTVTIGFGDFEVTIPAGEFMKDGNGVFTAKKPPSAPGVALVKVDFLREQVTLKAKNIDLGALPEGTFDTTMSVTLDDETKSVDISAARAGSKVRY